MSISSVSASNQAFNVVTSASGPPPQKTEGSAPRTETRPEPAARQQPTTKELAEATKRVQQFVETQSSDLQFSIDNDLGTQIVRVVDRTSKEVIRQIPSQEMLEIAKALDRLQGLLVKQQA